MLVCHCLFCSTPGSLQKLNVLFFVTGSLHPLLLLNASDSGTICSILHWVLKRECAVDSRKAVWMMLGVSLCRRGSAWGCIFYSIQVYIEKFAYLPSLVKSNLDISYKKFLNIEHSWWKAHKSIPYFVLVEVETGKGRSLENGKSVAQGRGEVFHSNFHIYKNLFCFCYFTFVNLLLIILYIFQFYHKI